MGEQKIRPSTAALKAAIAAVEDECDRTGHVEDETDRPLSEITNQIWSWPARTLDDLRERALIAQHWHKLSDVRCIDAAGTAIEGPWVNPNDVDDWGERAVAHLIHAVLGFEGDPLTAHPLVKEAKEAVDRYAAACAGTGSDAETDAAAEAALAHVGTVAQHIWSREPQSWADVVARHVIYEFYCCDDCTGDDGELTYLDPRALLGEGRPDVCDWSAEAHLVDALRKVGGWRPRPQPSTVKGGANV